MIPLFKVSISESVTRPLLDTLYSGYIGQGEKVEEFEKALAPWFGMHNILTLNNGTAGLHLALKLANVGYGDEVISTPMTCQATNQPIVHAGAKIIWADINPKTGNIDPSTIEPLITVDTKAIICVHFGGYPCDLDEINKIGADYGIPVIEDAAHAFGARYKGKQIGSISDYTMFSFQAIKHLTTVDGGALVVQSDNDYERGKLLRWYGMDRTKSRELRCQEDVPEAGFKYHMNDVTATIGIEQLKCINEVLFKHWQNANYYNLEFGRRKIKRVKPLFYAKDRLSAYWLYPVLVDNRSEFLTYMSSKGIHCSQVHTRNDLHTCFKEFIPSVELHGVSEFDAHQCSIPVHWDVGPEDRRKIMDAIEEF